MRFEQIPVLMPLVVGAVAIACTILIHALPLSATVNYVRQAKRLGRIGTSFWTDTAIVARAISYALVAHLVEVALWAGIFLLCGEFGDFGTAYYHSAVNYTTLGYGDLVMSPQWRMLGPLEAANGVLMFGLTTAITFAVIQRLVEARFVEFKE